MMTSSGTAVNHHPGFLPSPLSITLRRSLPTSRFLLSITRLSITQFLSQNRKCSRWRPGEEQGAGGAGCCAESPGAVLSLKVTARPRPPRGPVPAAMLLLLFMALTLHVGAGVPGDPLLTLLRLVIEGPAQEVPPSALNLTFDPGTWTLTWLCSGDITVTSCFANQTLHGRPKRQRMQNPRGCHCQFRPLTLHLGVTLEVNATMGNVTFQERLDYVMPGPPGSEAVNISCEIHDATAMTCAWRAGPAAPPDARYFLILRNATGHQLPGCPGGPTPSGCRIDDVTGLPRLLHVTVAGWSWSGGALRAYDVILNTKAIEQLSPPRDVTGSCNFSHCAVSWAPPQTWAAMGFADFRYELEFLSDTDLDAMVTVSSRPENRFEFPSPEPRAGHVVRVRAGDVRSKRWSAWSERVEFGATLPALPRLRVYIIVVAATLTCALGLALAWRR
ncbi:granulocyte-macrophage colony-stimulating factor receptor subunit alpha-like isoform X2 [Arvicola amphibius]|uniref:granulocyte-macrophage colony-stimulating factor receptor subunit alpha-like isoform X2 n=1 Tax=Arvicola amphibius TaxID=1047088 RepID=UPI0018E2B84D|nr:granulocyte-macrophage colony-stimulating factor receptor subunit alpha-like isoform X2 [Arvicola amphibius]